MQKGDKARVIKDCEVKAGSEVEVVEVRHEQKIAYVRTTCVCYFNGIRVEIAESNLEVIKKRWTPDIGENYWVPILGKEGSEWFTWGNDEREHGFRESFGVFKTREESDAMRAKIQAFVTSEIGEA